jgi:hypothetical protein
MEKDLLIQLTNNLYRLTLLFPKKEPLRYKIREVANCILIKPIKDDVEVLNSMFEVARAQNWVSPSDILAIQHEYAKLSEWLDKENNSLPLNGADIQTVSQDELQPLEMQALDCRSVDEVQMEQIQQQDQVISPRVLSQRQEKILMFLRENNKAQVWEMKRVMPEVTKRTLRRDFEQMLNQGLIERIGERNNTFYQIKSA